jgi:hypothetical protein
VEAGIHAGLAGEFGSQLRAVAALAPDDAWAVGAETPAGTVATLIERWNGRSWTVVRSPQVAGVLFAIDGTGPEDLWATGYAFDRVTGRIKTLAEHWNGHTWRIVATVTPLAASDPSEEYNVLAGVVVADGQSWAVGTFGNPDMGVPYHTLVERGRWVRVPAPSPNGSSLNGVAASSDG